MLTVNEFGLNTHLRDKKLLLKTEDFLLMILKTVGIEVFLGLTLFSRRTDLLLRTTRGGESDKTSSNIRFLSRIPSGGLT